MKLSQLDPDLLLTSHEVGRLLQANPTSINKWANEGKIEMYRTPGGHRRIMLKAIIDFLEKFKMPEPPGYLVSEFVDSRGITGTTSQAAVSVREATEHVKLLEEVLRVLPKGRHRKLMERIRASLGHVSALKVVGG